MIVYILLWLGDGRIKVFLFSFLPYPMKQTYQTLFEMAIRSIEAGEEIPKVYSSELACRNHQPLYSAFLEDVQRIPIFKRRGKTPHSVRKSGPGVKDSNTVCLNSG